MGNIRLQILSGLLLIVLLGFVWMQFRLNHELSKELSQANEQIQQMNKDIEASNKFQNDFRDKISQLEISQYNNQVQLSKKLKDIQSKPVEQQKVEYTDTYISVLECIEKKSMGLVCEK